MEWLKLRRIVNLIWITILLAGCAKGETTGRIMPTESPEKTMTATGGTAGHNKPTQSTSKTTQATSITTTPTEKPQPSPSPTNTPATSTPAANDLAIAREKIKHIVIIIQENRSFDTYFGTFPGADGIPMVNGAPTVCVPEPQQNTCVKPFHNSHDVNAGGPHKADSAITDIDGGKMDGFISAFRDAQNGCKNTSTPGCNPNETPDVMGWHDAREITNYWAYAQSFVLQDRMFEPNASWSLPSHLFMVSGWSAACSVPADPSSCVNARTDPAREMDLMPGRI